MKRCIHILLVLFCSSFLSAQKGIEPSKLKQFNITVNFDDYTVKTQMLSQPKDISTDNDKTYMWYASQKLVETRGGYDGKLIHGTYRSFYLNNQLREQGEMRYGLKDKTWKYWYSDGKLKEVICWKKGLKNGTYLLYNDYGQLMAKSKFKNDKLHGTFYTYGPNGVIIEKKRYKHGEEYLKKKLFGGKKLFRLRSSKTKVSDGQSSDSQETKARKKGLNRKFLKRKSSKEKKTQQEDLKNKTVTS
ncbi:MAG: hypothetical protein JNL60_09605 [Bacteroidia bacterium]|nr:hypothetical protein [Bacteroidia bacterium]